MATRRMWKECYRKGGASWDLPLCSGQLHIYHMPLK